MKVTNISVSVRYSHPTNGGWKTVELGAENSPAHTGDTFWCPHGIKHRISSGYEGLQWLEIAFGEFDENDIKRFDDRYGRA